jgi:hypothetical protein
MLDLTHELREIVGTLDAAAGAVHALAGGLAARTEIAWEGTPLWIVTLPGLRTLKRLRGSAQDRADVEALGGESS